MLVWTANILHLVNNLAVLLIHKVAVELRLLNLYNVTSNRQLAHVKLLGVLENQNWNRNLTTIK